MLKLILVWCQGDMIMGCYHVVAEYTILLQYVVTLNNIKRKRKLSQLALSSGVLKKPRQTAYMTRGFWAN